MPSTPFFPHRRWSLLPGLLIAGLLATGCATTSSELAPMPAPAHADAPATPSYVPVVRYGRYTLIELVPAASQQDLLLQVIDVSIPATLSATVGDALRYVLLRSGYSLCEADADARALYALPLPAAHQRLGPLLLRDALLTLAGSAWNLQIDDTTRRVCFARRAGDSAIPPFDVAPGPMEPAAITFPYPETLP